jgi:hypothetical protein
MSNEKFDVQDNLGSKDEPVLYTTAAEGDVEEGKSKPLKRALESRHMQMIAIVSLSLFAPLRKGRLRRISFLTRRNPLLGRCYRCWSVRWFRRSSRQWRSCLRRYRLYNCRVLDVVHHDDPW